MSVVFHLALFFILVFAFTVDDALSDNLFESCEASGSDFDATKFISHDSYFCHSFTWYKLN